MMQTNNGVHETVANDVAGSDVKGDINDNRDGATTMLDQTYGQAAADYQQQNRVISSPDSQQIHSQQLDSQTMRPDSSLPNSSGNGGGASSGGGGGGVYNDGVHHVPARSGFMGHNQQQHHHLAHRNGPSNYHHNQHQQQHQHHQQQQYPYHHGNRFNSHQRGGGDGETNINHVLLITVMNPHYPINCELIHQICSNYGKVNRIVIFKKNGVQAMVEFDSIESAKRAKSTLSGCDIYSGCCTLRIEYAKPTKLNIYRNDSNSYDYTNPNPANRGGNGAHEQGSNVDEQGVTIPHQHHQVVPSHMVHLHSPHGGASSDHHQSRNLGSGGTRNPPNHTMASHHYHLQPGTQQHNSPPSHGSSINNYGSGHPIDSNNDTFQQHQDAGYNTSRVAPTSSGYSGLDTYGSQGAATSSVDDQGPPTNHHQGNSYPRQPHHGQHHHHHHHHRHPRSNMSGGGHNGHFSSAHSSGALFSGPGSNHGPVMMLYGLRPDKFNCDRVFNLLCMYGNISKVKFLKSKEGCAMVQMGDSAAVDRCVSSLNDVALFDSDLQISYSKQPFLHDVMQPFTLPDGSPSFKDFQGNKNNRFKNPEVASKNRILPPSQVLHFFNAPYGITEGELIQIFRQNTERDPVSIKIFAPKEGNTKSFSGLAIFKDSAEATEALVICNHMSIPKAGVPHPYILRLCFSPPSQESAYSSKQS